MIPKLTGLTQHTLHNNMHRNWKLFYFSRRLSPCKTLVWNKMTLVALVHFCIEQA